MPPLPFRFDSLGLDLCLQLKLWRLKRSAKPGWISPCIKLKARSRARAAIVLLKQWTRCPVSACAGFICFVAGWRSPYQGHYASCRSTRSSFTFLFCESQERETETISQWTQLLVTHRGMMPILPRSFSVTKTHSPNSMAADKALFSLSITDLPQGLLFSVRDEPFGA